MNEKDNIIQNKSFNFAVRIVKLFRHLREKAEQPILEQLLRSGTSIGANVAEAHYASSSADFVNKLQIALKEAHETKYWLNLLGACSVLNEKEHGSIACDCDELIKLLTAIITTAKGVGNHSTI